MTSEMALSNMEEEDEQLLLDVDNNSTGDNNGTADGEFDPGEKKGPFFSKEKKL